MLTPAAVTGVWELVHWKVYGADATVREPLTPKCRGLLIYGPDGTMSGQMMATGRRLFRRPRLTAADVDDSEPEEVVEAFNGYVAYCGRFSVADDGKSVTHHVEAALIPNWVGTQLRREVEIRGSLLVLRTPTVEVNGTAQYGELTWRRRSAKAPQDPPTGGVS